MSPTPSPLRSLLLRVTRNPSIPLTVRKKLLRGRHVPPGIAFQAPVFGRTYGGVTGSHLDTKVYLYGLHEAATIRLMRAILRHRRAAGRPTALLDVGTNTGLHLIACALDGDPCLGFEPWHVVRDRALRNLRTNGLDRVRVLDIGLSDEEADLPFVAPNVENLGTGSFVPSPGETPNLTLRVRRGDDVVEEEGIAPGLIKIDTEGYERRVLAGLARTLERHRPAVIFELSTLSRADFPDETAAARLFPPGYRLHGIARSREFPVLRPFSPRRRFENLLAWPDEGPVPT